MEPDRWIHRLLAIFSGRMAARRREKTMKLCETLPLGDRKFLAVVQVERQKFLVASAGNSVSLLATLPCHDLGQERQAPADQWGGSPLGGLRRIRGGNPFGKVHE